MQASTQQGATLGNAVQTGIALRHLVCFPVKLRSVIETSHGTGAAPDTLLTIDQNEAAEFGVLRVSLRGTNLHTGRIVAMIARH